MSRGPFPIIFCDYCGKPGDAIDLVRIVIRDKETRTQHDLGYDFHSSCGISASNILREYGGVNLANGRSHHLLPGPGAFE